MDMKYLPPKPLRAKSGHYMQSPVKIFAVGQVGGAQQPGGDRCASDRWRRVSGANFACGGG